MERTPEAVAETYFDAWKDDDFDTFRSLLADDVEFIGPLAHLDNADDCVAGIERMSKLKTDIVVRKRFVDGADVLTWFDLHTTAAEPLPTANWSRASARSGWASASA
jgi:hypothetical protein